MKKCNKVILIFALLLMVFCISISAESSTDVLIGDVNGDGVVSSDDAIYMLRHTLSSEKYPINQYGDLDRDDYINSDDAIHLLRHTLDEEVYPIACANLGHVYGEAQCKYCTSVPQTKYEVLKLDFDTPYDLADYATSNGLELNSSLNGGEIKDGKWVYNKKACAIKDTWEIFGLESYSIEFDLCFNSFITKDESSVFTLITDNDGILETTNSKFIIPLRMYSDGRVFNPNTKSATTQLELGEKYHFKLVFDSNRGRVTTYIDDVFTSFATFSKSNNTYNCFRILDNSTGAEMWLDNLVITDLGAIEADKMDMRIYAVDGAYTRGGNDYADKPQGLYIDDSVAYVDIKYSTDKSYYREGFLKFDISNFTADEIEYAYLNLTFASIHNDSVFDVYLISSDWDSETITYNMVNSTESLQGKKIVEGTHLNANDGLIDLGNYIREAISNGEEYISIRIVPTGQSTDGQTRIYFCDQTKPAINVYDEKSEKSYFTKLVEDEEKNQEIWDYAQKMYDEWFARYQALPGVNEDAVLLGKDESQYTKTNYASSQAKNYNSSKVAYPSRPFTALTDFDEYVTATYKNAERDQYGGIMIESLKQEITGYFYTKKIDGRWWMIDPLGYPFISIGLSHIHYSVNGSQLQKKNTLAKYGTYENWAIDVTDIVRKDFFFNNSAAAAPEIRNLENGLPFIVGGGAMSGYGNFKNIKGDGNGSTVFVANNTMPVFDPEFAQYAEFWAKCNIIYSGNDRLIGYTSDNELPMDENMLDRAMTIDPKKEVNYYTYACTWTWLCNMTGNDSPTKDDITDELRDKYRGFVWDRYYSVVAPMVKKYDPDHMYMGTRFLTKSNQSEWVYRFSAQYLDCMTINWYFDWEPDTDALYRISRNGDMPFLVTEFYTKAGDATESSAEGSPKLGNNSGAGMYVETQTDRADFYETFTIRMLESANCVGWQWFLYMDNDPNSGTTDASSVDSNKGICRSDLTFYTELTDRMTILNKNVYNLIDYFANKKAN